MDVAYDHIQEEILSSNNASKTGDSSSSATDANSSQNQNLDLSAEFQETFRAFSASPWGARLGGLWDNVRKQGESYYEGARQEYAAASEEAVKGLSDLKETIVGRTRGLSLGVSFTGEGEEKDEPSTPTAPKAEGSQAEGDDGESFITRFRSEAAKRLKDIQKAEDAADQALLRFGTNIRDFLRDAVSIAPPAEGDGSDKGDVRFESKDADGKRVIHATRFEAQLHVIHTDSNSFTKDPDSDKWAEFKKDFDIEKKTDEIAKDLEAYPELRRSMAKLVPEQVEYSDFWSRYYFLRMVIETEERKRRELLKGAIDADEEEVGWGEDSDDESNSPSTPQVKSNKDTLKPVEPRRSNDQQSQADSESSYDLVSGTTSRTPGSPKEHSPANTKTDESDLEDWT
ncbi:hypothetical protein DTO212C5_452 [Paecilomyces variotii]|nr:hypothetical protein DTO212C5_452 [Paecilomyces variotii]KAJ9290982.1 hypothetical protein DTO021C3_1576 [Paecilomyces variotii]KAJ9309329.1 hypothetical protein DTO217A2_1267 [Paecilomyces variotii]KAJ9375144.1 hypothetical protein DTO282E5_128 [Paecilomyces variotii]KAJ9398111.1 hypothetical protein DTO282F9_5021 [Paecilomyces variotii]